GDRGELKCRLGDLARLTLLDPTERDRQARLAAEVQVLLGQARVKISQGDFVAVIDLCQGVLQRRPGDSEAQVLFARAQDMKQRAEWEAARRAAYEREQAL